MRKVLFATLTLTLFLCSAEHVFADVKIKQRTTMSGQRFESTRMIKGSRERTEQKMESVDAAAAAFMPQVATITQCDLRRTVKLNDRKQLYFVEPFTTAAGPNPAARPEPEERTNTRTRRGGTVTMSYFIRDTGERKMIFGLQARHLIITQEMESSADSCNGPSKMKMEYDGWYADFSADFNCPMNRPPAMPDLPSRKPDCIDRIVTKGNRASDPGFLLEGTMKMYGPDGSVQMTQTTETLELSRSPLNASLFDIPNGYREASSQQDLYSVSMSDMANAANDRDTDREPTIAMPPAQTERAVAVNIDLGPAAAQRVEIENYIRGRLAGHGLRMVAAGGEYSLNLQFRQIKESTAGKIGGIFGKVTGVDTKVGKVDIDLTATLSGGSTGEAKVKGKFDGPVTNAVRTAVGEALDQLLERLD